MVKRFWAAVVSLSVVVGILAGADQFGLLWWAVGVLALGLVIAIVPPAARRVRAVLHAYRERPALLARLEDAALRTSEATAEGRAQVVGALLALGASVPVLVSTRVDEGEQVQLCGKIPPGEPMPSVGARYALCAEGQEDWPVGTVVVTHAATSGLYVWLSPVALDDAEYWALLAVKAKVEKSPPEGMILVPVQLPYELKRAIERNGSG